MNVGVLIPRLVSCGPINVALSIIKSLNSCEKINFTIILVHSSNNDNILCDFLRLDMGVSVLILDEKDKLKSLSDICKKLDVVHSHGFYPDKLLSKINIKKITTVHSMFYKDYVNEYGYLKGFIASFLHFRFLKKGDFNYIVGCSKSVSSYIHKFIFKDNIEFINNGVDQNIFHKVNFSIKMERRKKLKIDGYSRVFLYSGRIIRRKRVPELIDIFKKNFSDNDVLLILGDGEELNECKRKGDGNIIFLGSVKNPEYYYQCSDFIISNSSAEGYPMSIIEAVSCGCLAILSDISPHREFIKNNSSVACLIDNICFMNEKFDYKALSSEAMSLKYYNLYLS